jgi:hypothetical protein
MLKFNLFCRHLDPKERKKYPFLPPEACGLGLDSSYPYTTPKNVPVLEKRAISYFWEIDPSQILANGGRWGRCLRSQSMLS